MPLLDDIQEVNLAYLHIVRRAISEMQTDIVGEMSAATRDWIMALTPQQLARVSRSSLLMCSLNSSSADLLSALAHSLHALVAERPGTSAIAAAL
ncbi:MAG: flagellar transcriptional regulator FlhD [Achromobacter sp.]|jgi:hypothetical protein